MNNQGISSHDINHNAVGSMKKVSQGSFVFISLNRGHDGKIPWDPLTTSTALAFCISKPLSRAISHTQTQSIQERFVEIDFALILIMVSNHVRI